MSEDKKLQNNVNKHELSEDDLSQVAGGTTIGSGGNVWERDPGGSWYYVSDKTETVEKKGWQDNNNNHYYYNPETTSQKADWQSIDGEWYYFYEDGKSE